MSILRGLLALLCLLCLPCPGHAAFAIFQVNGPVAAGCSTNGSDGQAAAPAGITPQFSTLLAGYAATPGWCVAGVGYAVGPTPNATASGNTITETGNANIPVTNDKKSFRAQQGGTLPSGITQGTAYFLCNVTNTTGSTYTYTLSTTTACGAPVTLTTSGNAFIALKIPASTTNTPANTVGWAGTANCLTYTFTICVEGNNVTLDHWDFSAAGGYLITFDTALRTNPTITNNYFLVNTNGLGFIQDAGQDPAGYTISNNIFDGNAVPVTTTAASTVGNGSSTITVSSTAGLSDGMTVCDVTNDAAIKCNSVTNNTYVTFSGTTATLHNASTGGSATTTGTVTSGDTLKFIYFPGVGGSFYRAPQISINDRGSTVAQYNWIRNTVSEHWQQSISPGTGGVANTGLTIKYNLFENSGWGDFTGAHGDVVQIYCGTVGGTGASCSFQTVSLNYNTVIQNNILSPVTTTTFSVSNSGVFGGTYVTLNIQNNTAQYPVGGGVPTSTNGLGANIVSWISGALNIQNNYVDPTSACDGSNANCGAASWYNAGTGQGGSATPTCNKTGNVNIVTGAALPTPPGGYC